MSHDNNNGRRGYGGSKAGAVLLKGGTRLWGVLFAAVLVGLAIHQFLLCVVIVHGESMTPSFSEGQVCLVDKTPGPVARGDVVIVHDGEGLSIKRVVGLPNESLLFRLGRVYVNGRELREPYLHRGTTTYAVFQTRAALGPEEYFVMGDNRGHSEDSRVYGQLGVESIRGRVMQESMVSARPFLAWQVNRAKLTLTD